MTSPYEQPPASRMAPMFFITCSVSASMLSCTSSFVPGSSATQPETNSSPFALIACATGREGRRQSRTAEPSATAASLQW